MSGRTPIQCQPCNASPYLHFSDPCGDEVKDGLLHRTGTSAAQQHAQSLHKTRKTKHKTGAMLKHRTASLEERSISPAPSCPGCSSGQAKAEEVARPDREGTQAEASAQQETVNRLGIGWRTALRMPRLRLAYGRGVSSKKHSPGSASRTTPRRSPPNRATESGARHTHVHLTVLPHVGTQMYKRHTKPLKRQK